MGTGQPFPPQVPGVSTPIWILLGGLMLASTAILVLRRKAEVS